MNIFNKKLIPLVVLAVLLVSACSSTRELTVQDSWVRPAQRGDNSPAYLIIRNATNGDDILLSASTEVAESVEIHISMKDANGVMSMSPQESIPIPAQQEIIFKPGGLHVMLVNLNRNLIEGDLLTLMLNFEQTGEVILQMPVRDR
jgi:copper(I)-binding protein